MITAWHLVFTLLCLVWYCFHKSRVDYGEYDNNIIGDCKFVLEVILVLSLWVRLMWVAFSHKDFLSSIIIL